jgi:hypothetical protein
MQIVDAFDVHGEPRLEALDRLEGVDGVKEPPAHLVFLGDRLPDRLDECAERLLRDDGFSVHVGLSLGAGSSDHARVMPHENPGYVAGRRKEASGGPCG